LVGKNSLYTGIRTMAHLKFKEFEMYKTSDWETERLKEQAIENRFGIKDPSQSARYHQDLYCHDFFKYLNENA